MVTFALQTAWRRKRRLAGTLVAVALGVAFLAATLVVGASARAGFHHTYVTANAGIDAYVRSSEELTGGAENTRPALPASVIDSVATVDGVRAARARVEGEAALAGAGDRPTTVAEGWIDVPELTPWRLAGGRAPAAPGEVVIDRALARDAGFGVGDDVTVLVPEPVPATVVGIATFGDEDSRADANLVAFTTAEAQRLLLGSPDQVSAVAVAGDAEVSQADLARRIDAVLPDGAEAVTGARLTAEQQAEVEGDLVDGLELGLGAFAFVALVVAALGIVNTFTILAAQRVRESALLRAIGASRRQVLAAAVVEAALVGLAGAMLGVALGVVLASGLHAATAAIGFPLPTDGLVIAPADVALALAVGVAVTVAGALPAAWRASRTAPMAALREVAVGNAQPSRLRLLAGGAALVAGLLAVLVAGGGALGVAAVGAVLLLAGLVLLGPAAVRPVCALLGAPLAGRRVAGDLGVRNAVRHPRRSAATAGALLVGVGVVSLFTVFGASATRSVDDAVTRSFAADLALTPAPGGLDIAPDVVDRVAALPEVAAAAGVGRGPAVLAGRQDELAFADLAGLGNVLDLDVAEGDLAAAAHGGLAVSTAYADERGWQRGDRVDVGFPDGTTERLDLAATYDNESVVGAAVVDRATWAAHASQPRFELAIVKLAPGMHLDDGRATVEAAIAGPEAPTVRDRDGLVGAEVAEVRGVVNVIYALLVVAVVIALTGIANTLSLSLHERTRELGLLRALGQTRAQLRAMVRWESVLLAAFGTTGGTALGVFLGWGIVRAVDARADIATFALPVLPLAAVVAAGLLVGVVAGIVPARRAARLPVLDALGDR
jgi:putative ABC transport system permease protein